MFCNNLYRREKMEMNKILQKTKEENLGIRMNIAEMEEKINLFIPNANFKYPEDYLDYDVQFGLIEWIFPREKSFIQDSLNHLKDSFGIENLVPFAINDEQSKEKFTKYACFLIDGLNNDKVVTIYPFGTADTLCQQEYENVWDWYLVEMTINDLKERMKFIERATCLGLDMIDDAPGPLVVIPKRLLEGNRLIMTTDAGIRYAENDDIKNTVENCGCGLKVLSVREIENEDVEVIMEVITEDTHSPLYVNGERIIPPEDVCVLVTPFAGEYSVTLETENVKGNRDFLWGDDYIYK